MMLTSDKIKELIASYPSPGYQTEDEWYPQLETWASDVLAVLKANVKTPKRKLGETQQDVLASLKEHGSWSRRCGWIWDTVSNTERVLKSLVRAGYVTVARDESRGDVYRPKHIKTEET